MTESESIESEIEAEFSELLHNFGPVNPIPVGAVALCGEVSVSDGPGDQKPLRSRCCPICLALTELSE